MTTAAKLKKSLESMKNIGKDNVLVTRSSSADLTSYVFNVYFVGPNVAGEVNQLIISNYPPTGCNAVGNPSETVTIATTVQGGFSEVQTVRVNVESGYIDGGLFKLQAVYPMNAAVSNVGSCIQYGAAAADVASTLRSYGILNNQDIGVNAVAVDASGVSYTTSLPIYGILQVGSLIVIGDHFGTSPLTVLSIDGSYAFTVAANTFVFSVAAPIYIVHSDAVQVSRYGTGNSTSAIVQITTTAEDFVYNNTGGNFRLRFIMNVGGLTIERATKTCLRHQFNGL